VDEVTVPAIVSRLGLIEENLVELVKTLCDPLFVVFDYAEFPDTVYREIVTDLLSRKLP
jgi:hypothetical protein